VRVLALNASPRRDGNSAVLLAAAVEGAVSAGHEATSVFLGDWIDGMLDDCRTCRGIDGHCSIPDRYGALLTEQMLPAEGLLIATPLHYYGMTARLKAFFDRVFCYTSSAAPHADDALRALPGKRIGLLVTSEETYPSAPLGLVHQTQEIARYQRQHLVGVVQAHGNSRGEVARDPDRPVDRARRLGAGLFTLPVSDYQFDTSRSGSVWASRG
jgi:multimeric flavodoxin WrbA